MARGASPAASPNRLSSTRSSAGLIAASSAASAACGTADTANSPVETSAQAMAASPLPSRASAAIRLQARGSSRESSVSVPGVTMRVMARCTTDFAPRALAALGSSVCSPTATLKPALISRAR